MLQLLIKPSEIPCSFAACPPGLFIGIAGGVGIKDEYDGKGYNEAGEYWCSDALVIPCYTEVEDNDA